MDLRDRLVSGIGGGLLGGVVFALVLQAAGRIDSVALLVADESTALGWTTLLVITGVLGLVYGLTFGRLPHTWLRGAGYGLAHGVIWWILGVLLIMPLWVGYPIGTFGEATWFNLLGYVLYGLVTGLVTAAVAQRGSQEAPTSPEAATEDRRERADADA